VLIFTELVLILIKKPLSIQYCQIYAIFHRILKAIKWLTHITLLAFVNMLPFPLQRSSDNVRARNLEPWIAYRGHVAIFCKEL
jgi:hypothetical protein